MLAYQRRAVDLSAGMPGERSGFDDENPGALGERFLDLAEQAGFAVEGPLLLPPEVFTFQMKNGHAMGLTDMVKVVLLTLRGEDGDRTRGENGLRSNKL